MFNVPESEKESVDERKNDDLEYLDIYSFLQEGAVEQGSRLELTSSFSLLVWLLI